MDHQLGKPTKVSEIILRFRVVLLLFTLLRLLFYFQNSHLFDEVVFSDFLAGIWCDTITFALYFLPFVVFYLFPIRIPLLEKVCHLYFHVTAICLYILNCIDIEYFSYTAKRSTFDLFKALGTGHDFSQLWATYLLDFWMMILVLLLTIFIHFKLINYGTKQLTKQQFQSFGRSTFQFLALSSITFLMARGGIFRKPFSTVDLIRYTSAENIPLVANSGFTMIKSYGKTDLEQKNYFSKEHLDKLFNPEQTSNPQKILEGKPNVVIIVLESFGIEFIGKYSNEESYTPFLDSVIDQSLWFENAYANGMKSNEGIPAIVSSIPSLMNSPYIASAYSNNKERGLASILKNEGYTTAFFHGATNGSMNFDSYSKKAGFQYYFGRTEYANNKHFDGYWGISDEYFNPWAAKKISSLKPPFFATLFTISSHHPYYIPSHLEGKIKRGPQPICASINYGDYALQKFFEEAKKQDWYKNTIFVLCADHTPSTTTAKYKHHTIRYRIPIIFFDPSGRLKPEKKKETFQQLDIMPTILDLLNIKTKFYAFGRSLYSEGRRESISFLQENYYYYSEDKMLTFNEHSTQIRHVIQLKNSLSSNEEIDKNTLSSFKNRLKAIVQRYNNDLLNNQTTTK